MEYQQWQGIEAAAAHAAHLFPVQEIKTWRILIYTEHYIYTEC